MKKLIVIGDPLLAQSALGTNIELKKGSEIKGNNEAALVAMSQRYPHLFQLVDEGAVKAQVKPSVPHSSQKISLEEHKDGKSKETSGKDEEKENYEQKEVSFQSRPKKRKMLFKEDLTEFNNK